MSCLSALLKKLKILTDFVNVLSDYARSSGGGMFSAFNNRLGLVKAIS